MFLQESVVLKLNGGLGTSMGLDKAKSLLTVKGSDTFLDLTAKQVSSHVTYNIESALVLALRVNVSFGADS